MGAYLRGADLSKANLYKANFYNANLSQADLSQADLSQADLSKANFYKANLKGANLTKADLSTANLSLADLYKAYLYKADLKGADLSTANLSKAYLKGAQYNDETAFPFWFTRIGKGMVKGVFCSTVSEHEEGNELSYWERLIGVKSASSFGEQECPTEGTASINNEDRNRVVEKGSEDSESDTNTEGVIR